MSLQSTTVQIFKRATYPLMEMGVRMRYPAPDVVIRPVMGVGDNIMMTAVAREMRRRGVGSLWLICSKPSVRELLAGNPDFTAIVPDREHIRRFAARRAKHFLRVVYSGIVDEEDRDTPCADHFIVEMARNAGLTTGTIEIRPSLALTEAQRAGARLAERQIAIQASHFDSSFAMRNKEWPAERFQAVADRLRGEAAIVQVGDKSDPKLDGVLDLRGKTTLCETAAVLSQSLIYIGGEGGLMHMARAVDRRSVIVYGGRIRPEHSGYSCNANLVGDPPCSPCWRRSRCDYNRICLTQISAEDVVNAALNQLAMVGEPLTTETGILDRNQETPSPPPRS